MSGVTDGVDEELENYFDSAANDNEMEGISVSASGTAVPRRSPPSAGSRLVPSSKTKNSTNRERGSMGKALHRACDMFGREGKDETLAVMLSMQM